MPLGYHKHMPIGYRMYSRRTARKSVSSRSRFIALQLKQRAWRLVGPAHVFGGVHLTGKTCPGSTTPRQMSNGRDFLSSISRSILESSIPYLFNEARNSSSDASFQTRLSSSTNPKSEDPCKVIGGQSSGRTIGSSGSNILIPFFSLSC
jgi:hypothetical protein